MKPRRTVIGAAALSLAVAGSLAGAGSAKADGGELICTTQCGDFSPRTGALGNVLQKFSDIMYKYDNDTPFLKLETAFSKVHLVFLKFNPSTD